MHIRNIIPAAIIISFLAVGSASAQTVQTGPGGIGYSTSPNTSTVTPGASGASLGTIQLSGGQYATGIQSIPITVNPGGGAGLGNLSSCRLYGPSGSSLMTGNNVVSNLGSGTNTFTFDQPISLAAGSGNSTTLTIRCDVASNTPSSGMFTIAAQAPTVATAFGVNLDVAPSVPAGSQDVTIANISLDARYSGSGIRLSSIPVTISAGNGASSAQLTDCRIRNASNLSGFLNTNAPTIMNGGTTAFSLATPISIAGGASDMLAVTCDISAATPVGGTFAVSIAPNAFAAVNATTGVSVPTMAVVGTGPNGLPASTAGTVIVSARTSGGTGGNGTTTPGIPNTGAGGQALQLILALLASGAIAVGGATYLRYQMR